MVVCRAWKQLQVHLLFITATNVKELINNTYQRIKNLIGIMNSMKNQ